MMYKPETDLSSATKFYRAPIKLSSRLNIRTSELFDRMATVGNKSGFDLPSLCGKDFDVDKFLKQEVDLSRYFSKTELVAMGYYQKRRFKNFVQNYEMMLHMGLPAIKPDFMKGPSYRAKQAKTREREALEAVTTTTTTQTDSDEEWTPDMERKKREKEKKKVAVPYFEKPKKLKRTKDEQEKSKDKKPKLSRPVEEKRKYNLRDQTTTNYMILEPPDDDCFIFCEECEKEYDMDCPVHGALLFVPDTQVEMANDPEHALHTLPAGLVIKESTIPGAGRGVISQIDIPVRTMFGPYGGIQETDPEKAHTSGYSWQVFKAGKPSHFIDARDIANSNWMRFVNCANLENDQNLVAFQYKGGIYYRTYKTVTPGTELLVWYGDEYGRELGVIRDKNLLLRPKYLHGEEFYPCVFCKTSFTTAVFCVRHLLHQHGRDKLTAHDIQTLDAWLREHNQKRYHYHNFSVNNSQPCNTGSMSEIDDQRIGNVVYEKRKILFDKNYNANDNSNKTQAHKHTPTNKTHNIMGFKVNENIAHYDKCNEQLPNKHLIHRKTNTDGNNTKSKNDKSNLGSQKPHYKEKPYKCDLCEYSSSERTNLVRHMKTHSGEKPFKCDVCGYSCSRKQYLVIHMRTHSGEKPFKCDVCGYSCSQKPDLIKHMRTHSGEKPFKCDVCGYSCSRKYVLVTHMRIHSGEKPFKCNVCGFSCSQKPHLVTHMRAHSGDKPFKCNVCGYASNQNSALVAHMRTHSGEKPFKCDVCGYSCSRKYVLVTHMRIHSGEKPFKCNVCQFSCSDCSNMAKHVRKHSGMEKVDKL